MDLIVSFPKFTYLLFNILLIIVTKLLTLKTDHSQKYTTVSMKSKSLLLLQVGQFNVIQVAVIENFNIKYGFTHLFLALHKTDIGKR